MRKSSGNNDFEIHIVKDPQIYPLQQGSATNVQQRGTEVATNGRTAIVPPSIPANFKSTVQTAKSISLQWNASARASDYVLQYKRSIVTDWTTALPPTGTTATITGLSDDTPYDFRIKATNIGGESGWVTVSGRTKAKPPTATGVGTVDGVLDINSKDSIGNTLLHRAAWDCSNVEKLIDLVSRGANVNAKNNDGRTPLHYAAWYNPNPEVFKYLINQGAVGDAKDNYRETPLDLVVSEEKKRILREILESQRIQSATNQSQRKNTLQDIGQIEEQLEIQRKDTENELHQIEKQSKSTEDQLTSIENQNRDRKQQLQDLETQRQLEEARFQELNSTLKSKEQEVEKLESQCQEIENKLLQVKEQCHSVEIELQQLENKYQSKKEEKEKYDAQISDNEKRRVELQNQILSEEEKLQEEESILESQKQYLDELKTICQSAIEQSEKINVRRHKVERELSKIESGLLNEEKQLSGIISQCQSAIEQSHRLLELLQLEKEKLLQNKLKQRVNRVGMAIKNGDYDTLLRYIESESVLTEYVDDESGMTFLHLAARTSKHIDIIKCLVQNNSNIDAQTKDGHTPLHYSAKFNTVEITDYLIQAGADTDIYDNSGKHPIDYANENNRILFEESENATPPKKNIFGWVAGLFKFPIFSK